MSTSVRSSVEYLIKESRKGNRHTMLGIGPMSENLIRASLELSKEKDFPIMFIASRNQVDAYKLGGGYVFNSDQKLFVDKINEISNEINYDGIHYVCRDHGGPWQRDKERADKLEESIAMAIAKESYKEDILNGFDLLHIDPTKDPDEYMKVVDLDVVFNRTIELIEYCESIRKEFNIEREIAYEVGTEETSGGLTSLDVYEGFIKRIKEYSDANNMPMPVFIVGQTGTLTRLTENVGTFNYKNSKELSDISTKYGVGLKEHNGDYLSEHKLLAHLPLNITAMNVAPEFGNVETLAVLELSELEQNLFNNGMLESKSSIAEKIEHFSIVSGKWKKWLTNDVKIDNIATIDNETKNIITHICGHYTFSIEEVEKEMNIMLSNLQSQGINGKRYIVDKLKESMNKYVMCFNLEGLSSKINEYSCVKAGA